MIQKVHILDVDAEERQKLVCERGWTIQDDSLHEHSFEEALIIRRAYVQLWPFNINEVFL